MDDQWRSRLDELKVYAHGLGLADESQFFGLSQRAAQALDKMTEEPPWDTLAREMEEFDRRWEEASQEERAVMHARATAVFDEMLAEARRRLAALR